MGTMSEFFQKFAVGENLSDQTFTFCNHLFSSLEKIIAPNCDKNFFTLGEVLDHSIIFTN